MIVPRVSVADLVSRGAILAIQDGNHGEIHPKSGDYVTEGIPFVMSRDLNGGRLDLNSCEHIRPEQARSLRVGFAKTGDVLLTHKGTLGLTAIVPPVDPYVVLTPQVTYYRTDPSQLSADYLRYAFQHASFRAQMASIGNQSTRPFVSITAQRHLQLLVPPLSAQRRIAAILSVYDDLIENNNRRILLLEEMARRIYQEWFLDFRYPGHEAAQLVASELGRIPLGWQVMSASTALEVNPRIPVDRGVARPFVPMTSLSESTMHIAPIELRATASGARFQNGDTLFARITPCLENGKTAFVQFLAPGEVASGSTEFIVLRGKCASPEYVYLLARSTSFRDHAIKSMSGATGRQRVRETCFDNYVFAVPTDGLMHHFSEIVGPMFALSYQLFSENRTLSDSRELLLPRLISGEIDVGHLSIELPEAA